MAAYPFVLADASISVEGLRQDDSRRYGCEGGLGEEVLVYVSRSVKARLQGTYLDDLVHLLAVPLVCCSHVAFLVIGPPVAIWIGV